MDASVGGGYKEKVFGGSINQCKGGLNCHPADCSERLMLSTTPAGKVANFVQYGIIGYDNPSREIRTCTLPVREAWASENNKKVPKDVSVFDDNVKRPPWDHGQENVFQNLRGSNITLILKSYGFFKFFPY